MHIFNLSWLQCMKFYRRAKFLLLLFLFRQYIYEMERKVHLKKKFRLFVEIGVDWGLSAVNREWVTCGHHSSNSKYDPMELNVKKANGSCIEMAKVHCMQFSMAFHVRIRFKLDFQVKMNSFSYCWNFIVNTAQEHKIFEAHLVFSTEKFQRSVSILILNCISKRLLNWKVPSESKTSQT